MPPLPKKIKNLEAKFGLKLRKWIEVSDLPTCFIETKDTRGKKVFKFSELSEDQRNIGLLANGHKGVLIRIQTGTIGAPDYVWAKDCHVFIVIKYPCGFVLISIGTLMLEIKKSKSLSWTRAKEISTITVDK